jgi:Polysulphide reductase, NrfD
MQAAGYANREITHPPNWHTLVEIDFFLNGLATGLFLVAAVAELAKPDAIGPVARWAYPIALILLLADLACLVFDLGNPARFHHMLRVFKPLSPMSLGTWCLTAFSLPLTALVVVDLLGGPGWLHVLLIVVSLPLAFGSAAYKGVLFSTTAQPGWRDARWLGAFHITGALVVGAAGLLLISILMGRAEAVRSLCPVAVALVILNLIAQCVLCAESLPALSWIHPTNGWLVVAGVILIGGLLPIGLLTDSGSTEFGVAAGLLLANGFVVRVAVVRLPHWAHG